MARGSSSTSWILPVVGLIVVYLIVTRTNILSSLSSALKGSGGSGTKGATGSTSSSTSKSTSTSTSTSTPTTTPTPSATTGKSASNANAGQGTPGWYTLSGHHHCGVDANGNFSAGCLCTDPKKCIGHAGTGAPYCAAHLSECWPTNKTDWCAYWYASDQQYCNLCNGPWKYVGPAGSGAKPCP